MKRGVGLTRLLCTDVLAPNSPSLVMTMASLPLVSPGSSVPYFREERQWGGGGGLLPFLKNSSNLRYFICQGALFWGRGPEPRQLFPLTSEQDSAKDVTNARGVACDSPHTSPASATEGQSQDIQQETDQTSLCSDRSDIPRGRPTRNTNTNKCAS